MFAKCFQTYHEYSQVVDLQIVTSDALNACRSIIGKKKFNERFEEWSWSIQRTADALNACRSIIGKKKFNERFEEWSWSIQRTADETLMFPC